MWACLGSVGERQAMCVWRAGDDDRRLAAAVRTFARRCGYDECYRAKGAWLWKAREGVAGAVTMVMDRRWWVSVASFGCRQSRKSRDAKALRRGGRAGLNGTLPRYR
jgi:hypothetical protein